MKRTAGYTLLELLVVIAIIGVVSGIGVTAFHGIGDRWGDLKARTDLDRAAEQVFTAVRKDISDLISPKLASVPLVGLKKQNTLSLAGDTQQVRADQLTMPVTLPTPEGLTASALVKYRVGPPEENSVGWALMRESSNGLAMNAEFTNSLPVARGVVAFAVEYQHGGTWEPNWRNRDQLPDAIRVSITLVEPDNARGEQIARTAVFPIRVE
jgi:prepilin-type N-terminal cleavage/methylation domain-containing protein